MVIDRFYPVLHQLALPRTRWIIIGLHLLLLLMIGLYQGFLTDKEAMKYIGCAQDVLASDFTDLTGNYLKYGAFVLFLLPFVAIGQVGLVIAAQVLLGIIAAEALARFVARLTANMVLGRLVMALFLLCPLIQTWALALYTEHFFTCMVILFIERLDGEERMTPLTIGLGMIALFARPTGLFFVLPALVWKWRGTISTANRQWMAPAFGIALFLFAINVPRIAPPQLEPIASGQVIAGVGGIGTTGFEGHTISAAQRYLMDKVGLVEWVRISLKRTVSPFTLTRPYYSTAHNGLNAIFYALFPLALIGAWRSWHAPRTRLVFHVLALNVLLIALTHDEWSGRFLVPMLPWIMVLAILPFGNVNTKLTRV